MRDLSFWMGSTERNQIRMFLTGETYASIRYDLPGAGGKKESDLDSSKVKGMIVWEESEVEAREREREDKRKVVPSTIDRRQLWKHGGVMSEHERAGVKRRGRESIA